MNRTRTHLAGLASALSILLAACGGAAAPASPSAAASAPPASTAAKPSAAASAAGKPAASASAKPAASGAASAKPGASGSAPVAKEVLNPKPAAGGAKITICIPARSNSSLPAFAAVDSGLLANAGIDASMPYFAGGAVDVALAAGQCDFVFGAGGVGPLLQGVDVVVVAVTQTKSPLSIWGKPSIKSIAELKGHSVGTTGAGSLSWRLGRYFVRSSGMDPDKDVTFQNTGDNVTTLAATVSGRVDAAVLSFPYTAQAQKQGLAAIYEPPADFQFVAQGVTTTKRYLTAHHDIVKAVVKGVTDAMTRLKSDEAFYGQELKKYTGLDVDQATLTDYWKTDSQTYTIPPVGSHKGAVTALSLYSDDANMKDKNLDDIANRWLDTSILDELFPAKP
jgi:ABC-type nitrate/sulfonate/bicarbonate transport system substrate-binding protein